jgi:hypothetical protein
MFYITNRHHDEPISDQEAARNFQHNNFAGRPRQRPALSEGQDSRGTNNATPTSAIRPRECRGITGPSDRDGTAAQIIHEVMHGTNRLHGNQVSTNMSRGMGEG